MLEIQIASIVSVVCLLVVVKGISVAKATRSQNKMRQEYHALQELKPKLEKFNMRLHEVSEGLYHVVQYASKTSNKAVFQLSRSRKGICYIKINGDVLETSKSTKLTASYLNNRIK